MCAHHCFHMLGEVINTFKNLNFKYIKKHFLVRRKKGKKPKGLPEWAEMVRFAQKLKKLENDSLTKSDISLGPFISVLLSAFASLKVLLQRLSPVQSLKNLCLAITVLKFTINGELARRHRLPLLSPVWCRSKFLFVLCTVCSLHSPNLDDSFCASNALFVLLS